MRNQRKFRSLYNWRRGLEKNGKFYEYSVIPEKIGINKIDIQNIKYKPSSQYFSMYWDLAGEIKENNIHIANISIKKVGGNLITYNCLVRI